MLIKLLFKSILNRRSTLLLTLLTLSVSVFLLFGVQKVRQDVEKGFFSTVSGTDLIVGARSGPVQLLLYSVFHIGNATNNIRWSSYQALQKNSAVDWLIPLSLGDSHHGYRVVGTNQNFFQHFAYGNQRKLLMAAGKPFNDLYDVVLGANVARHLHYTLGDEIVVAHGSGNTSFSQHKDKPFRVSGILQPTGTPVDNSLYVSLAAIEAIHLDWRAGVRLPGVHISADQAREADLTPHQITAVLVGLKSRFQTFALQRQINSYRGEPLLAILPGVALQQLWQVLSQVQEALMIISACVVLAGFTGMLGMLLAGMEQRRRELAILRSVGARPATLFALVIAETLILTASALVIGVGSLAALIVIGRQWLMEQYGVLLSLSWSSELNWLALGVMLAGLVAGIIPAWRAYRYTLSDGLTLRL